jgi:N-acetylglutamate synthase-like GNAT family acetyltransferase
LALHPKYIIRNAKISDLEFIHKSLISIYQNPIALNDFETIFKKKIKSTDHHIFILENQSISIEFAGLLIATTNQHLIDMWPTIEILEIFIMPKYRKFGAADFLYNYLEGFAKAKKVFKLKVSCKINSTLNQSFYTHRGFRINQKQYTKPVY